MRRVYSCCGAAVASLLFTAVSSAPSASAAAPAQIALVPASSAAVPRPAGPRPALPQLSTRTAPAVTRLTLANSRLDTRVGRSLRVRGRLAPARRGSIVALQVARRARWSTIARTSTRAGGGFIIDFESRRPTSLRARLRVSPRAGAPRVVRRVGRLNVFRVAAASWYGPGLFGNRTGCGGRLSPHSLGVAHKQLACGTLVTVRHGARSIRVPVMDRGPYVGAREFDLTSATARRLHFTGHGPVLVTR